MKTDKDIKEMVRQKYSEIALQDKDSNQSSCCGASCCSTEVYNIMTDDYSNVKGYEKDADLGLGCGLPTAFAKIKQGDVVLDLGSGAGNDCFVARSETGPGGKVIGIDFTEAMIDRARQNADKLGYHNVEFRQGDIEQMPIADNSIDVVVSNCVLNLVPNKKQVFSEIYRVLKPGGHFSISDIVLFGQLPEKVLESAEMYAGCVSGAIQKQVYLDHIKELEFENIQIQKEKAILIPDDILVNYLDKNQLDQYHSGAYGIESITVFASKPKSKASCCAPGCCS
ncbi:MAG: arsenite methyltransferase [Saprospiraceae bacterium]|nr:arsenite methyltransferase [Saprospiraceae bacterium]HRG67959.1 arsenite methyltransferase [Saprospiraceae bacterium]